MPKKPVQQSADAFRSQYGQLVLEHIENARFNVARADRILHQGIRAALEKHRGEVKGAPWVAKFHDGSIFEPAPGEVVELRRATGQMKPPARLAA